jgi:hydantoinase/carbamoylase family amidase
VTDVAAGPAGPDARRILRDLKALSAIGGAAAGGVDRPAFSLAYSEAVAWLAELARRAGLRVRQDAAGNLIARLGPPDAPAVVCGSHIDSVPGGGIYDGTLGVLAGLECARALADRAAGLTKAFEVVAFVDEEGAYLSLLGSRAMAGDLDPGELAAAHGRDGRSLAAAMRQAGLDPRRVLEAARPASDITAYVELHIEQGPVLESTSCDIGIVTDIVGLHAAELTFLGEANHAGTTPLSLRKDAFRAAAQAVTECFDLVESAFPADTRLTYGEVALAPGASNVVPGEVRLTQEIRAIRTPDIDRALAETRATAERVAALRGVGLRCEARSFDPPVAMSEDLVALIEAVAAEQGASALRMASGAGHDAQAMAKRWHSGMIFVPSAGGVSHNPAEETGPAEIERGARVLYGVVERLVSGPAT